MFKLQYIEEYLAVHSTVQIWIYLTKHSHILALEEHMYGGQQGQKCHSSTTDFRFEGIGGKYQQGGK